MGHEAEEADTSTAAGNADEKLLETAHARFKLAAEAERKNRLLQIEDKNFCAGEQWPDEVKRAREADKRPCLTVNRMPQFVQQVTNDQRQNRPSIKTHPVDDGADPETAKIIQGMIRHIEYDSNADVAYDTGFQDAVEGGRGGWRVLTEYESPLSFNQVAKIKAIRNSLSMYLDPYHQEPDGSDMNWGFVVEDLSPDEFKSQHPQAKLAAAGAWEDLGTSTPDWMPSGKARVAEYFYKETEERKLALLSDGTVVEATKENLAKAAAMQLAVVKTRKAMVPVVKWCKLNACEILEKREWLGSYIPLIPVYGTVRVIDGELVWEGIVRHSKDSQRMLNFWKSAETETIALAPRAPWVAAEGQLEGHEEIWRTANSKNHAYLPYKPVSVNGTPAPPPQRQTFEPAIGAITQAAREAAEDLKSTTGIYDASLGGQSRETSGIAIQRRNIQAQTSNFHFVDNLARSIKHTGRILVDLIPKIYDTARAQRIIGEDDTQQVVKINQAPGADVPVGKDGKPLLYRLDAGRYDVTVDTGPSYASKRQETAAAMIEVSKANPAIMQVAGDLLVKSMDWPGAQEVAERLKKTPGIAALIDDPNQKTPIPPQVQAQLQSQGQMIENLTKSLHEAHDLIDTKRIEIESRERIEMAKLENQATIELAKLESKESLQLLQHQIQELDARQKLLGMGQPIPIENDESAEPQPVNPSSPMTPPGAEAGAHEGMGGPTGGEPPGPPDMEGNPWES